MLVSVFVCVLVSATRFLRFFSSCRLDTFRAIVEKLVARMVVVVVVMVVVMVVVVVVIMVVVLVVVMTPVVVKGCVVRFLVGRLLQTTPGKG